MAENEKVFVVYKENELIFVFKFKNLSAEASRQWAEFVMKYNGTYPEILRILYDFTECLDSPSRYSLKNMASITPNLIIPENTRFAYLAPNQSFTVWSNAFFATVVKRGQGRSFLKREEAVAWLMENTMESDSEIAGQVNEEAEE